MHQYREIVGTRRMADLAVLLVLASMAALYCYDVVTASTHIYNLILVLPLTILVITPCVIQFFLTLRAKTPPTRQNAEPANAWPAMLLFAAYVLSLNWLGFDVGTCLFTAAFLYQQGERRWLWLIGYAVAFALLVTVFFREMLPYPMPTLVIGRNPAGGLL